jgi:hypothetical protein
MASSFIQRLRVCSEHAVAGLVCLLRELLHPDPAQRPELGEVCERAFLRPFASTPFRPMGSVLGRAHRPQGTVKSTLALTPRKLNAVVRPLSGGACSPTLVSWL